MPILTCNRLPVLLGAALVCATSVPAQETMIAAEPAPWAPVLQQARFEMNRGDFDQARSLLDQMRQDFSQQIAQDRAAAGLASTYLKEKRYAEAIQSLEDSMAASETELFGSRQLYAAIERRVGRARNRAREEVARRQAEYDDISWWNVFKLFTKLDKRKQLKQAEEDLEELEGIYSEFEPALLFPIGMPRILPVLDGLIEATELTTETTTEEGATEEGTGDGDDEDSAATESSDEGTGDDSAASEDSEEADEGSTSEKAETDESTVVEESSEENPEAAETSTVSVTADEVASLNRQTAYETLSEEIDGLLALIPEDKLAEADAILDGIPGMESLETEASAAASEETTDDDILTDFSEEATGVSTDEEVEVAELDEAADTDESATPTEGTLDTVGGSDSAASADVVAAETEATPAAATPVNAREAYVAAYQALQAAIRSGDQEAIQAARDEYLVAVQTMRTGVAPSTTSEAAASEDGEAAASEDAEAATEEETSEGSPAAPGNSTLSPETSSGATGTTPAAAGSSVTATQGSVRQDRSGVYRGLSDGVLRQSRGSFHR